MSEKRKARSKRSKNSEPNSENILRPCTFPKYYATNVYCGVTTQDFRVEFLNEKEKERDGWYFVSDAMAILSPTAAKRLNKFLEKAISLYEAEHGIIQTDFAKDLTY